MRLFHRELHFISGIQEKSKRVRRLLDAHLWVQVLVALLAGIDRILDMCRTTVNVTRDLTACSFFNARLSKYFDIAPSKDAKPAKA